MLIDLKVTKVNKSAVSVKVDVVFQVIVCYKAILWTFINDKSCVKTMALKGF